MAVRWQTNSLLQILEQTNNLLAASLDYQNALKHVTTLIVPTFADYCVIHLVQPDQHLEPVTVAHVNSDHLQTLWEVIRRFPPDASLNTPTSRVLRTRKAEMAAHIPDLSAPTIAQNAEQHRLNKILNPHSYIVVPLIARERMLGIMTLVNSVSKRRYANRHLKIAQLLAQSAALTIDNALLYQKAEEEASQRKRVEESLKYSESRLQLVTDALPVLISYVDSNHCYQLNNRAYENWFKRSRAEIKGKHMREVLGAAAYETIQGYVKRALAGETVHYEAFVPYSTGGRHVNATYVPDFGEDGTVHGAFILVNDVTQRIQKEEREALMQDIMILLAETVTPQDVTGVVVNKLLTALGAYHGAVGLLTPDGNSIYFPDRYEIPDALYEKYQVVPLDLPNLLSDSVRTGQTLWVETQTELLTRYPAFRDDAQHFSQTHASIAVPFRVKGTITGGIYMSFPVSRNFTAEDRVFLETIAHYLAQTIERARSYEAEKAARTLSDHTAERISGLQKITADLSKALTYQQVAQICVEKPLSLLNANIGGLSLITPDRQFLETIQSFTVSKTAAEYFNRLPLKAQMPLTDSVRSGQPIWITSMDDYRQRYPQMAREMEMLPSQAFANLPLIVDERVIGGISFGFEHPQGFSDADRAFMVAIAQQCAQNLRRAQLSQQAKEAAAAAAAHEERQRLARELHDAVSQVLFSATTQAEALPIILERNPQQALEQLNQIVILNRAAMAEMRTLLLELRPEAIMRTPLSKLIDQLLNAARGRRKIETTLLTEGNGKPPLDEDAHVAFYRIAQEGINNVLKHSRATTLNVYLGVQPANVLLRIQDNGRGFDTTQAAAGLGLNTMQERAASINATLQLDSQPGNGTEIRILWKAEAP